MKDVPEMKYAKRYYPSNRPEDNYTEENFKRWSNARRCAWTENMYDQLTRNKNRLAKKYDVTDEQLEQMKKDAATLRKLADAEEAAKQTLEASTNTIMNSIADDILKKIDKSPKKGTYLSPRDILGKKGN